MNALLVFLKAPRPGEVKTRLTPALDPGLACAVHRALAEETLRQTRPRAAEYARTVIFAPEDAAGEIARWLPGEGLRPQRGGDLGARMAAAVEEAFAEGAARVVVVGADVAGLTREHVRDAVRALATRDVVLGPAHDGGYYLVGLSRPAPGLFQEIPWSTPEVLAATAARATALGLSVARLGVLRDVDTAEDVRAEWPRLSGLLAPPDAAAVAFRLGL